jgi:hypothetical protein
VRAMRILQREFGNLEGVHDARLACVEKVISAVLISGRLALSLIGRSLEGACKPKHAIKCVDRLLGNVKLHAEIGQFYARIASQTVSREERPILLIDWTDIGTLWAALVVTLVSEGRGVVLCAEVHSRRKENNPRIESSLLRKLRGLLPSECKPILVSDAGFRGPWLKKVVAEGWDFVGRVRGRVFVRRAGSEQWLPVKQLWGQASARPSDLGDFSFARYLPVEARVVALWKNRHSRRAKLLPRVGRRKQKGIRAAREPWILVTSLRNVSAREIVKMYGLRMRIELTFRDQKCPRFGLALDQVRTNCRKRVEVYLLLATLAHYVAMLIGQAAELANLHRDYQANTVENRRVLSWPRLGREILRRSLLTPTTAVPPIDSCHHLEIAAYS